MSLPVSSLSKSKGKRKDNRWMLKKYRLFLIHISQIKKGTQRGYKEQAKM